jgi:ABC-type polar amino acid transport system ATPase subunit
MTDLGAVLQMHGIRKRFGSNEVLKGINLAVQRGEVLAIIGPSGSGKSTLARCISLIEEPEHGEIRFLGCCLVHDPTARMTLGARWRRHQEIARLRRSTSMVFQQFNLFPHLSVLHNVTLALRKVKKLAAEPATVEALEQLGRVGLSDKRDAFPGTLSGGQQQRVAIARALATKPELIIFDEATSSLDPELTGEVLDVMRQLADDGMTMVVITHEMDFAREVADRVIMMDAGHIHEEGPPDRIFTGHASDRTQTFLRHFRRRHA